MIDEWPAGVFAFLHSYAPYFGQVNGVKGMHQTAAHDLQTGDR